MSALVAPLVQAADDDCCNYNWVVGASTGYAKPTGSANFDSGAAYFIANEIPFFDVVPMTARFDDSRLLGQLFGGYQARCNLWLVGTELQYNQYNRNSSGIGSFQFDDAELNPTITNYVTYQKGPAVGLTGRLGYQVGDFMPYVRVGVETSRDKLQLVTTFTDSNLIGFSESRRTQYRYITGIGLEAPLRFIPGLNVRGEFNHYSHGKKLFSQAQDSFFFALLGTTSIVTDANARQSMNSFIISVAYDIPVR